MVDVQTGMRLPSCHREIDERLEGRFLGSRIERPSAEGGRLIARPSRPSEQIFQAADPDIRVAFDIEEDIALRRFGQAVEPLPFHQRQELMHRRGRSAPVELNAGLLAHPVIGLEGSALRTVWERERQFRQACQRSHTPAADLLDLEPGNPRHEAEMVVLPAPAARSPTTSGRYRMAERVQGRSQLRAAGPMAASSRRWIKPMVGKEILNPIGNAVRTPSPA